MPAVLSIVSIKRKSRKSRAYNLIVANTGNEPFKSGVLEGKAYHKDGTVSPANATTYITLAPGEETKTDIILNEHKEVRFETFKERFSSNTYSLNVILKKRLFGWKVLK